MYGFIVRFNVVEHPRDAAVPVLHHLNDSRFLFVKPFISSRSFDIECDILSFWFGLKHGTSGSYFTSLSLSLSLPHYVSATRTDLS